MIHPDSPPARLARACGPALLVALTLAGCGSGAAPPMERPPAPVTVATAVVQDVPVYLDEIGTCTARELVEVQPQVAGRITEIHFEDGADLKQGQPLFTIDPRPYQARLDSARASLAQMQTVLDLARNEFKRVQPLIGTKAVSQQDYDTREHAVAAAEAQVQQNDAAVETARLDLEYCSIVSPIEGRAGHRLVDPGNVVAAMSGPLLVIQRLDPIYADFTVTENDLTSVQENMARGTLGVEVRLPDDPDHPSVGELTFLDNAVQGATGTVRLRATVPNAEHRFWPGRFVKVRLVLATLPGAVLVPAAATQLSATGPFVYVIGADDTAELRPVTLGQRHADLVVVADGLAAGERVVLEGQIAVTPGGKVLVTEPGAAAPAGQPAADAPAKS